MRKEKGERRSGTPSLLARRCFLKRAAWATTVVSASSILPIMNQGATREAAEVSSKDCANANAPMREVEGKVAFITGGSSGIGLGIARAFADAGMKVAIGYRTKEHLEKALQLLGNTASRIHAISIDVTDRPGMEKAAAEVVRVFGRVHVLVNNAGVVHSGPLRETTYDDWDWVMGVNVNGVFNGVRAFLPHILNHGEGGQIVTTSSIDGLVAHDAHPSYTASKFAVVGMMEALRAEFAGSNIGVSVYCPGTVKSRIGDSIRNRPGHPKSIGVTPSSETTVSPERARAIAEAVMDPLKAGQLVLHGMRSNDLYILTHRAIEELIHDRNETLVASLPRDSQPTDLQMELTRSWRENSIYRTERNRLLCIQSKRARIAR